MIKYNCELGTVPITKNDIREKQIKARGATPIEKNVIVVDEQGNEYEATYMKRAKGLVKNGRARFVGENKICLACPPDKILEENEMTNNIPEKQIFDKIAELQKSLESIDKFLFKIQLVTDSQSCVEPEEGEPIPLDYLPEVAMEKIKAIREIVLEREKTINKMLDFYLKLYQDEEAKKIGLIKTAFDNNMAMINDSNMETQDKFAALGYVTDKIAELVEGVINKKDQA